MMQAPIVTPFARAVVLAHTLLLAIASAQAPKPEQGAATGKAAQIDRYFDDRFDAEPDATDKLLALLFADRARDPQELERMLRAPRHSYPAAAELIGKTTVHDVTCLHVDYASKYRLYVPPSYTHDTPCPLVLVGHGGNSSMSPTRAARVADHYLRAYAPSFAKHLGAIVIAPHSSRGWGHIGNSLLLSCLADAKRKLNVDPDRIFATGQSMGGHMAYRAALLIPDRFGAVSPQSGGYDFAAKKSIGNLRNVPGYVTWGKQEPYGIDVDNRRNQAWAEQNRLDWVFVEKNGGHKIYADELPKVARFFAAHPRNLYRDEVYLRAGGAMKFVNTWGVKGWPEHVVAHETRPLRWNLRHWLELTPRPDHKGPLTARARYAGDNRFDIDCDQVRQLVVHLHPKMVDFAKPVRVYANGKEVFAEQVTPDPVHMLELARSYNDRGRIFWASVRVAVADDRPVSM
ncbi:MAG: alpha/beta hydrolase-fold protein [Planctomycetota bacterium]